jgi:hypothetical protein
VLAGRRLADPGAGRDPSGASATVVRLSPLSPSEGARFVTALLVRAGMRADLSSREAVLLLAARSGGVPRVLSTVATAALLLARAEGTTRVKAKHLERAIALQGNADGVDTANLAPVPSSATSPPGESRAVLNPKRRVASRDQALRGIEFPQPSRVSPVRATKVAQRRGGQSAAALCAGIIIVLCVAWLGIPDQHRSWRATPPPRIAAEVSALRAPPVMSHAGRQLVATTAMPSTAALSDVPSIATADPLPSAPTERAPKEVAAPLLPSQVAAPPPPASPSTPDSSVITFAIGPAEADAAHATSPVTHQGVTTGVPATSPLPSDAAPPPGYRTVAGDHDEEVSPEAAPKPGHAATQEANPSTDIAISLGRVSPSIDGSGPRSGITTLVPPAVAPETEPSRSSLAVVAARRPVLRSSAAKAGSAIPIADLAWATGYSTGPADLKRRVLAASSTGTGQPAEAGLDRRCRNILIRSQLGEGPSYADQSFLRDRCVSSEGGMR